MPDRCVLKWAIPIDDHDHPIGAGPVVHTGTQNHAPGVVFVWTDETAETLVAVGRRARVYRTGHTIPPGDAHLGSAIAPPYVWHVYGSAPEPASPTRSEP